jgi:hypothetical protein
MPSGYEVAGGADLDSVLAPFHSGWPQASAVGYSVGGANLNARYAPLSTGGAASATGYKQASADLNTIFAALGSTGVQVGTQPANVSGTAAAGNPSGVVTSSAASCAGSKGGGTYTYTWHTTGCTATSPSSQSTTFFATVNASSTDSASAFCTISDGVTSINTSTISVTLQNTSPLNITVVVSLPEVSAVGPGPGTLTTDISTATPSGGTPPYAYAWTFQSGGAGITLLSPNTDALQGRGHVTAGQTLDGFAICTVTDSVGTIGTSPAVEVLIEGM